MAFAPLFDPTQQFMARSGAPLAGGLLYVYRNTSQELATLKNVAGTTIANPVSLDADGRAAGGVFVSDASTYTLVVKDAFDATLWTIAAMSPIGGGSGGGGGGEDNLWGHWENTSKWVSIPFNSDNMHNMVTIEGTPKLIRTEGEIGPEGIPYLQAGLYDFKLEFAMQGTTSVAEAIQYDLHIKYGDSQLRGMSFTFHDFGEQYFSYTEWCAGVFKMPEDGYLDIFVNKARGNYTEKVKVSHLFIHTIE